MQKSAYVLSREAGIDLAEIEDFTARNWGDDQAEVYLRQLFDAFALLADRPKLGHVRDDIPKPYLAFPVGSHLIIYRHNETANRVEILNILHPAMDIAKRVKSARLNLK